MRIAFVGKGGSGKTTLSALFASYCSQIGKRVVLIDADLNMHLPAVLGFELPPETEHLSYGPAVKDILTYLRGSNERIRDLAHFRKTTPPAAGSRLIDLRGSDYVLSKYGKTYGNLTSLVVGTYNEEDIGASCYHNNLAILENLLSHMRDDRDSVVITDMVAGVDAFANTLHAQFDILVLTVEPTQRGVEVYRQYRRLAEAAGVEDRLFVMANKVADELDEEFIRDQIPHDRLIGLLRTSPHLRRADKGLETISAAKLEPQNEAALAAVLTRLEATPSNTHERLQRLWALHKKYVAQAFITERFGDLTNQIDPEFSYENYEDASALV